MNIFIFLCATYTARQKDKKKNSKKTSVRERNVGASQHQEFRLPDSYDNTVFSPPNRSIPEAGIYSPEYNLLGTTGYYEGHYQQQFLGAQYQPVLDEERSCNVEIENLSSGLDYCNLNDLNKPLKRIVNPHEVTHVKLRSLNFQENWELIKKFLNLDCIPADDRECSDLSYYSYLLKRNPSISDSLDTLKVIDNFESNLQNSIKNFLYLRIEELSSEFVNKDDCIFSTLLKDINVFIQETNLTEFSIEDVQNSLKILKVCINVFFKDLKEETIRYLDIKNLIHKSVDEIIFSCSKFPELLSIRLLYNDDVHSKTRGFLIIILLEMMNDIIKNNISKINHLTILFRSVMFLFKKSDAMIRDCIDEISFNDNFRSILLLANEIFPSNKRDKYSVRIIDCINNVQTRYENKDFIMEVFFAMLTMMYDKSFFGMKTKKLENYVFFEQSLLECWVKRKNIETGRLIDICGSIYSYVCLFKEFEWY